MLRYIFALILFIHGAIHLLGFAKAFKPTAVTQLTQPISKPVGVFWLFAFLFFLTAAILFIAKTKTWWIAAIIGLIFSQALIIRSWKDAKFGTIANVIILLPAVVAYGNWRWRALAADELNLLLANDVTKTKIITEDRIQPLPDAVRKWLRRSNVIGKKLVRTIHLDQVGEMRTTPSGKWMRFQAEQYSVVDRPGFLWTANVEIAPLLYLTGRDKYINGRGNMLIRFLALIPVANAKGPTIDQGALARFLAEIVWFPAAAFANSISWQQNNESTATATIRDGELVVSATFSFNAEGDVRSVDAMRYFDRKTGATLEKWHVENDPDSFKEFQGIRIPTRSDVTWKLHEGDFTWFRLKIQDVQYNTDR